MKLFRRKDLSYKFWEGDNSIPNDCWIGFGKHTARHGTGLWLTISLPIPILTASVRFDQFDAYRQGWHRPVFRFRFGPGGWHSAWYMMFFAKHRKLTELVDGGELAVKPYQSGYLSSTALVSVSLSPVEVREYKRAA